MFSRFKRKQGAKATEKFEFRFQFQASGVPFSGYDRLLVCVVPSGRGKSAAKTQKAPLRNGSVAWPGLLDVRMKLNRDKKGGRYEEAMYRFVVTSTNSRSGILGESSLNMADCTEYVQKEKSLLLMNGSGATGAVLHMTITSVRLGVRDGNASASSGDEEALSEDEGSQDYSESLTDPGSDGFGREIPVPRIKVPILSDETRNSRLSQEPRDVNAPPGQPPRVVLQPGRDRMARYDAYALNGEGRSSAPTLAPILIAQQPNPGHGRNVPSVGRALTLSKAAERTGAGSFLSLAQTGIPSGSYDEGDDSAQSGDFESDRPSRSGGEYSDTGRYEQEEPTERRLSYGGVPDPLAVIPPRGSIPTAASLPIKVKELAAQIRERELESPASPLSPGDRPQPRFQVSADRYVGRGLDRPPTSRASESGSSESGVANSGGGGRNAPEGGGVAEADMVAELERMEVEIEGLRAQSESWQRSARNYAVENEQLRGENGQLRSEMKVQIEYTDEAGAEADEAARERDEARVELEKLRSVLSHTQEAEDRQATTQWEVDDARRHVEELEEELLQHKEHIEGLQVQLDRLTESNQMLVEEVKDFEEQHDAKEAELESLKQQLETGRSDLPASGPSDLLAKLAALEKENQSLLARLDKASSASDGKESVSNASKSASDGGKNVDGQGTVSGARGPVSDAPRSAGSAVGTGAVLAAGTGVAVAGKALGNSAELDKLRTRVAELEAEASKLHLRVADSDELGTGVAGSDELRTGVAETDELRTRVAELEAEASELASELASVHKELDRALLAADGSETPRGNREEELIELQELVETLEADLASAREGREIATRQYDRLKQLLEEDNSEERIEELEKENQELQAQLASVAGKPSNRPPTATSDQSSTATSDRPPTANSELLAQVKLLETARESLTAQAAAQAQEARSARLDLETRLGKAELERTEAEEKLRSLEAEVAVLKGSESGEKEQDAVAAFKGSLQAAADQSQQRLDATLDRVRELEEEVNRQSFLVSKAEGAAFEAEERLKIAHLEFSEKSRNMVEKLAALQEELEQVADNRKGLDSKHVLTLRGLEMRHGEREQELQRKHLAEWGDLHAEKQELETKHKEVTALVTGLENRVSELERTNAALEDELAGEKARLGNWVSGEKEVNERKVAGLEAAMASVTAQLNESLRVETESAKEYEGKEKALREEVSKLEDRVKELTEQLGEAVHAKDAVQKMWDDSEVSGKESAEKIRAVQSQLDRVTAELNHKTEESEELHARIEELHSLVEDAQSQSEEFRQRVGGLEAEAAERETSMKEAIQRLTSERDAAREQVAELSKELEGREAAIAEVKERLTEINERLARVWEERDGHELEAGRAREEVETHKSKGVELAALLAETQERLTAHEETAGSLSRELETTAASHTEQAALLKDGQQKVKKLEAQVVKLTGQIEEHVAAKEANHRRMSFAMQEGALAGAKVQDLEEELERLTKEVEGHAAEKEELTGQLAATEAAKSELEGLLKELRETHEELTKVTGRLQEEHNELKGKHEELGLERDLAVKQHQETAGVSQGLRKRVSEQESIVERLAVEVGTLTGQLGSETCRCEGLEGRVKELELLVKKANEERASEEEEVTQSLTKIEQLEGDIRTLTADLEIVRKEYSEHQAAAETRLSTLTDGNRGAEGRVKELMGQLAVLTSQLQHKQEVEARALDLDTERSGLQERLTAADAAHKGALERVSVLTAELTALKASSTEAGAVSKEKVDALEKEKRVMALDLEKAQAHVAELEGEVGGLRERLTKTEADHESLAVELSTLRKHSQEDDVARNEKLKGLVFERDSLARETETLSAEIEQLRAEVTRVQSEVTRVQMDKQAAVERLEEEMRTLHGQFQAGASDKEKAVSDALMSATAARAEKAELEGRLRRVSDDEQALQGAVNELENRVKGLESELESAAEREEGLQGRVKSLEEGSKDADVALKGAGLTAAVKAKMWQGEREKLERSVEDLKQGAAGKAEEWQTERGRLEEGLRVAEKEGAETIQTLRSEREQLEKNLTEAIAKLRSEKEGQEKMLTGEKSKLEGRLKDVTAEAAALSAAKEALEVRVGELSERAATLQAALSSSKEAAAKLEAEKNDVETEKGTLAADHKETQKGLSVLVKERQALQVRVADVEAKVADVEAEKAALNGHVAEYEKRVEGLTSQLAEARSGLQEVTQQREGLQKELQTAEQSRKEAEGSHGAKARALEAAAAAAAAESVRVRSDLAERTADVERLAADVDRLTADVARVKGELAQAVEGRSTAERQLAESTAQMRAERETVMRELESEVLRLREGTQVAVAESTVDLRSQIEGLRKAVEDEKANGKRSAVQAANSASAETEELRDENFELKHRLIELETERGRRYSSGGDGAPENGNATGELRMKVTMLETELQNKAEQLAGAERRLQEAREEGIIFPANRPGLSRPGSLARGIASPGAPELLMSPSGRSLLSPGTRRALAQSKNGRNDSSEAVESPGSPAEMEAKRADLQHRVKSLEGDLKKVIALLEKAKKEAGERERGLLLEVDRLQTANEQLAQGGLDLGMDQLRSELLRLQNQNAALTRNERELQAQLGVQEVLEEEVLRLQEANDDLFQKISLYRQYGERAKTVERLHTLEVELQEAMEANLMYKEQLKAALSTHQNVTRAALTSMGGDVDSILEELQRKKQQARRLESELLEMQNRYTSLSLKCAEVEANREEVVQELKRMKSGTLVRKTSLGSR